MVLKLSIWEETAAYDFVATSAFGKDYNGVI
jgi:hypothetical protein